MLFPVPIPPVRPIVSITAQRPRLAVILARPTVAVNQPEGSRVPVLAVIASGEWQSRRRSNGGLPTWVQPQRDCHVAALLAMTGGGGHRAVPGASWKRVAYQSRGGDYSSILISPYRSRKRVCKSSNLSRYERVWMWSVVIMTASSRLSA